TVFIFDFDSPSSLIWNKIFFISFLSSCVGMHTVLRDG
ncbi:MAG: hypothetical protein ACI9SC_002156, partial [Gammaproteobacteria bacterium]